MSDEQTSEAASAAPAFAQENPSTAETLLDSGRTRRLRLRRSGLAMVAVALVSGAFAYTLANLLQPAYRVPMPAGVRLAQELAEQRQRALRDYLHDELGDLTDWALLPVTGRAGGVAGVGQGSFARGGEGRGAVRALPQPPSAYEKIYGRAARYTLAAHAPLVAGDGHVSAAVSAGRELVRGAMLQARLLNELASNPAHGAAIATLTAPAKLGKTNLPAGTQLHGAVRGSGNSDTRVFVDFSFARLASGETLPMVATAADRQGREGIPGKKSLTRAAAGSVGLAAASRAGQVAGQSLAGGLGSILGAGVEGATASGGDKAMRLDHDDYVVLVAQGTQIRIYVREFMPQGS